MDTLGAFQWNPATISSLPNSADMSVELLMPHSKLSSSVAPGAFGPGTPPIGFSGSTNSNAGTFPLPAMGFVYKPETSLPFGLDEMPVTLGLGVLTTGGFGCNFPGSSTNPILMPPPPNLRCDPRAPVHPGSLRRYPAGPAIAHRPPPGGARSAFRSTLAWARSTLGQPR